MDEAARQKLEGMLEQYEAKRQVAAKAEAERRERERASLEQFVQLRDEVIRPVMEDFAAVIKEKGHAVQVVLEGPNLAGARREGTISLRVSPGGDGHPESSITFAGDGAAYVHLRLHFRNRAGESVFPGGHYAYQELTAQGVEAELLEFLERILAGRA